MNIQTVAENLRNTIAGKELLLELVSETERNLNYRALIEININELKRILEDMKVCIADDIDANKFTGV